MEHPTLEILVLDDEASIRWVMDKTLAAGGHRLHFAEDAEQAAVVMRSHPVDFAMVDINLPGEDGFSFLKAHRVSHPQVPVAVITGQSTMDNAITAMKLGAFDYLTKPFDIDEVESLVARAAQAIHAARKQVGAPAPAGKDAPPEDLIVGNSRSVREIYKSIGRVAETEINVLIQGESGTGKELIARSIHHHSGRADFPFVAVNCAAIPRELLESELFGHEKGAFTGATDRKKGRLELAGRGTLFLDEIGDMALELQAKLLRVLQEREFQRVGGVETLRLEARILAATNQSLPEAVATGGFRADLYYRLGSFLIEAVPLRERREDIAPLAEHFLRTGAEKLGLPRRALAPEALDGLMAHDWPGNVRELENVIKSLMIMSRTNVIQGDDLPRNIGGEENPADLGSRFERTLLQHWGGVIREACEGEQADLLHRLSSHLERPLIRQVLHLTGGNQLKAASVLGINRNTLRTKMKTLGIRKPARRATRD